MVGAASERRAGSGRLKAQWVAWANEACVQQRCDGRWRPGSLERLALKREKRCEGVMCRGAPGMGLSKREPRRQRAEPEQAPRLEKARQRWRRAGAPGRVEAQEGAAGLF